MNLKKKQKVVVVLGMHRSGTSVITKGLQALGVDLGENLMPPRAGDNERGYFEDLDIFNLNERIFSALGTTWHAVCPINERAYADIRLDGFKLEAIDIFNSRLKSGKIWAFKDPRTCRLLPFWQEVFAHLGLNCRYLLVNRNPISVATSLAARNGFPAAKSHLLWVQHVLGAIKGSEGRPRLVVDYDMMMESPAAQLQRVGNWLGISDQELLKKSVDDYAAGFVAENLRHSVFQEEDLKYDTSAFQIARRAFGLMRRLAADEISFDNDHLLSEWAELTETYESISPVFSLIDDQERRLEGLDQALSDTEKANQEISADNIRRGEWGLSLQAELETLRRTHAELEAEHSRRGEWGLSLQAELETLRRTHAKLEAEHRRRGEWGLSLQAELVALRADYQALNAERDGQINTLNQSVSERDGQIANLIQAVAERDAQFTELARIASETKINFDCTHASLKEELATCRAAIQAYKDSYSWRITYPLRLIGGGVLMGYKQVQSADNLIWRTVTGIFNRLPVNRLVKDRVTFWLFRRFPAVFRRLPSYHSWQQREAWLASLRIACSVPKVVSASKALSTSQAPAGLPTSPNPLVSIVIPVHGKIEYTVQCLESIAKNAPAVAFEVIVVDDCSPDETAYVLSRVRGIRVISNKHNLGFIRSCNLGAKLASGEYLHFLNNDTEVTDGWLDELVRTFHEFPGTGLAGSKLVYPDGTLQEAGGIIWQDGSAWNFGRHQDATLPVYNYAREVDYCSGASIMTPTTLFNKLGGFDEHYVPAYCEDADFALKIREQGHRVIYQPHSVVIHYEGVTSGTDTSQGAKAYQIENTKKLFERWGERIKHHQVSGIDVDNAKDRMAKRRALVLDHCTPTPDQDSGSMVAFNTMLLLREMGFQVTFIPEDNFLYMPDYTPTLQRAGIEVLYAPYVTSVAQHLTESGGRYDLAFVLRPDTMERNLKAIRKFCPRARVLYHTIDLHYLRMEREAELFDDPAMKSAASDMKHRELAVIKAADASIVHSSVELEILRPLLPSAAICVFPLILDIRGSDKGYADRNDIVFVGGYQHPPNVDAVHYFVKEIMPLLRNRLPDVRFYAVGSKPPGEIQALASDDVIITGFVDDLAPLLDKMRVSVAPLRYGAGIKGKIGTAMAAGLPVVATPLAAEGMSLTDGGNILVADGAAKFAEAVVKLFQDESLWDRISQNGVRFAENVWGAEAAWKILAVILDDLGIVTARGANSLSLFSGPYMIQKEIHRTPRVPLRVDESRGNGINQ